MKVKAKLIDKNEIDYWNPYSKIIVESILLRDSLGMSQSDLAALMDTKQSVISRFENMGRTPSYDFFARLSSAFGHSPGMTLCGEYMAIVPFEKQNLIKELAKNENVPINIFVQKILDRGIDATAFIHNKIQSQVADAIIDEYYENDGLDQVSGTIKKQPSNDFTDANNGLLCQKEKINAPLA